MKKFNTLMSWLKKIYRKKNSPGYLMQLFSMWASIIFAGYAIYLTIEIDRTDTTTEKLVNIVEKMDTTNQNLIFSQSQNDTIIRELYKQNLIQNSQLKSLIKQYDLTKDKALVENKKVWLEYESLIAEFREFVYIKLIFEKSKFLNLSPSERKQLITELSELLDKILLNPVVYGSPKYYSEWTMFKNGEFKAFLFSMSNYPINSIVDINYEGKLITSGEEYLNKVFDRFKSNFNKLENEMGDGTNEWHDKYLNMK